MKSICIIGDNGHYHSVLEAVRENPSEYQTLCISPGFPGENISGLKNAVDSAGIGYREHGDYQTMLQNETFDAAVVCSEFNLHAEISLHAMKKGVHVLCEKPLCTTREDYERLSRYAGSVKVKISAMLAMRYEPQFYAAYKAIRSGEIGNVRLLQAQKSYKLGERPAFYRKRDSYGGTILWVGIHAIDWIQWLSGESFVSVSALHSNMENFGHGDLETTAAAQYAMTNNAIATVTCDYYRPDAAPTHGDDRIRVTGTKGVVEVRNDGAFLLNGKGSVTLPHDKKLNSFDDFIRYINGAADVRLDMEQSFAATLAALKALESADTGATVVF